MTHQPRAVITIGLGPTDVRGRPIVNLQHDHALIAHISNHMQDFARTGGVCPHQVMLRFFDDVELLAAHPLEHPCPGCLAGRDQAIAGMRAGEWAVVVSGVVYGHAKVAG